MPRNYKIRDPNYASRIYRSFEAQGIMAHLGAKITSLGVGMCEISLPFNVFLSQQHGFFHGGVTGVIADSAGGYAAATLYHAEDEILTVEYKLNLIAPADGDWLIAKGHVVRSGKSLTVTTADIFVKKNDQEKQIAIMQQTLMRISGHNLNTGC